MTSLTRFLHNRLAMELVVVTQFGNCFPRVLTLLIENRYYPNWRGKCLIFLQEFQIFLATEINQ